MVGDSAVLLIVSKLNVVRGRDPCRAHKCEYLGLIS
jgi:hypothetical protein